MKQRRKTSLAGLPAHQIRAIASPMKRLIALLFLIGPLGACQHRAVDPPFATKPYVAFNREDAVAIALREWRLFGSPVEDEAPPFAGKPERLPGLWERVGEYWWLGQKPGAPEAGWTGKHDARGAVFPAADDGNFAWSAAFISYVMRMAGAGDRFPYAPSHSTYVNAAAAGRSPILRALAPERYAPLPGDLICFGRGGARDLTFADLPTSSGWPGHCAIVVARNPDELDAIGGNVGDAVTLSHVPTGPDGKLVDTSGAILDPRHKWFVVLQVLYDAETEPASQQ